MCGFPRRLNRIRSIALASVAVPTVERGLAPIRSWSTMIAVVRPSRRSTSGRASVRHEALHEGAVGLVDHPLRLGGDRAEDQRALARSGDAREHRQPPLRELDADVLEVVLPRALDADQVVGVGDVQRGRVRVRRRGHAHRAPVLGGSLRSRSCQVQRHTLLPSASASTQYDGASASLTSTPPAATAAAIRCLDDFGRHPQVEMEPLPGLVGPGGLEPHGRQGVVAQLGVGHRRAATPACRVPPARTAARQRRPGCPGRSRPASPRRDVRRPPRLRPAR